MLYCLIIIDEIIYKNEKSVSWSIEFLKKKGVADLIRIYSQLKNNDFELMFNLRCITSLSKILAFFFKNHFSNNLAHFEKSFEKKEK